ncbi:MAG: AAA family ATPase [Butyrivibrio sp.]|nr:AAA family ATPase [Butyrivibrio sp.]
MLSNTQANKFNEAYENYRFLRGFIIENADMSEGGTEDIKKLLLNTDLELQMSLCDISALDTQEMNAAEQEFIKSLIESAELLKTSIPGYAKFFRHMTSEEYRKFSEKIGSSFSEILTGVRVAIELKERIGKNLVSEIIGAYHHIFNAYAELDGFRKNQRLERISMCIGIQAKEAGEHGIVYNESTHDTGLMASGSDFAKEGHSIEEYQGELAELVGLKEVKNDVNELVNILKVNELRKKQGIAPITISNHMVFTGNPGTGKTTVARILAGIYKQLGILSKGHLVEVDRAGLVAAHIGGTEEKTMNVIESAVGGVLFIDEAYALAKEGNDFGQYAIDTLIKAMEDRRDDLVVIVAGYPELMNEFIESNPGIKSRFTKYIRFPDYDSKELHQIFLGMMKKDGFSLENGADAKLSGVLERAAKDKGFGNGRGVRNLYEEVLTNQASRVIKLPAPTKEDLLLITKNDIPLFNGDSIKNWYDSLPQSIKLNI